MSGYIFLGLRIGMALALYAFLAWAVYTLWMTLQQQARQAALPRLPILTLSRAGFPDLSPYRLFTPEALLGRDPVCAVCLDDPAISGRHLRFYHELSQWWAQDLASKNGSFLNGEKITDPIVLFEGDRLQVGQVELLISFIEPSAIPTSKET